MTMLICLIISIVKFCASHKLAVSVKSGGYGTAGWAINGDVIIDLKLLDDVEIEEPGIDGKYVALSDMLAPGSKGKDRARTSGTLPPANASAATPSDTLSSGSQKRERSPDPFITLGLPRNARVADFLIQSQSNSYDLPPPSIRRRMDPEGRFHPSRLPFEQTVPVQPETPGESDISQPDLDPSTNKKDSSPLELSSVSGVAPVGVVGEQIRSSGALLQSQDLPPPDESHRTSGSTEVNTTTTHAPPTRRPHVSTAPPHTSSQLGLRSEDPFGYLSSSSSTPSSSSLPRSPTSYVQPAFQQLQPYPLSLPGPSRSAFISPSSGQTNDSRPHLLSQLAADSSSTIPYLTSVSMRFQLV